MLSSDVEAMFDRLKSIVESTNKSGAAVAAVLALLVVSAPIISAATAEDTTQWREEIYTTDLTTGPADDPHLKTHGAATYSASNDWVDLSNGGAGTLEYVNGTPDGSEWAVEYNEIGGSGTGTMVNFYVDDAAHGAASSGYSVIFSSNSNTVKIRNRSSGSDIASKSVTIDSDNHLTVEYENGTVEAYMDGTHVLTHTIQNPDTSHTNLSVSAWNGANNNHHKLTDMQIYGTDEIDSDGDGEYDKNDDYPYNAPQQTRVNNSSIDGTPDSAYAEASNGSFTLSVYGVNNTTDGEERVLIESRDATVTDSELVTVDVPPSYDAYIVKTEGDANVTERGVFSESQADIVMSGGGSGGSIDASMILEPLAVLGGVQTFFLLFGILVVWHAVRFRD